MIEPVLSNISGIVLEDYRESRIGGVLHGKRSKAAADFTDLADKAILIVPITLLNELNKFDAGTVLRIQLRGRHLETSGCGGADFFCERE
jgi:hypothetical protein